MTSGPTAGAPSRGELPRWAVDEMLGRLVRYLRFLGHDTLYLRGVSDDAIVQLVDREHRHLITRDRRLATRVPGSLLLASPRISDQFQAVFRASPGTSFSVRFDRCTLCNGLLEPALPPEPDVRERASAEPAHHPSWRCVTCGHVYWEGTHTASVRARVDGWLREASP